MRREDGLDAHFKDLQSGRAMSRGRRGEGSLIKRRRSSQEGGRSAARLQLQAMGFSIQIVLL
jgi:hypothetical protein